MNNPYMEEYKTKGFTIIRSTLSKETIRCLRDDIDRLSPIANSLDENGFNMEIFGHVKIPRDSPARNNLEEYLNLRGRSTLCPPSDLDLIRDLLFKLSQKAGACMGVGVPTTKSTQPQPSPSSSPESPEPKPCVYLFNEQYVVKPEQAKSRFLWHRDVDRQLDYLTQSIEIPESDDCGVGVNNGVSDPNLLLEKQKVLQRKRTDKFLETQGELCAVWVPLDEVDVQNGSLVLLPLDLPNHPDKSGCAGACPCSTIYREDLVEKDEIASCEVDHGLVVSAAPGDIVVFSSTLFHTSGHNRTNEERRVFYCNFSVNPVLWTVKAYATANEMVGHTRKRKREEGDDGNKMEANGKEQKEGRTPFWFAVPIPV